ncbi:hypothetical protein DYI37_03290 [Fulvimarina endophytica]|uniref:Uncharacterized protein n=1 Tax=Fulvimarina endophytica TaxID=2293836 RepID=A0A371XB91_9HYPH|nr:hypothetical protein [Fulvimarina endophytica]RFC66480.1 hypothetical protein DYI37_03290 [Fulvimarina endophytica]
MSRYIIAFTRDGFVVVTINGAPVSAVEITLTPSEARVVARNLTACADYIDAPRDPSPAGQMRVPGGSAA